MTATMVDEAFVSIFLAFLSVALILHYVFVQIKGKHYPPGPWGLPLFGHLLFLGKYPAITFRKWSAKYGNVFRIRMGSYNCVVLNGYDTIKAASEHDHDVFSDRINFLTFSLQRGVNDGIYTLTSAPFDNTYLQGIKATAKGLRLMTQSQNKAFQDNISQAAGEFKDYLQTSGNGQPMSLHDGIHQGIGSFLYKLIYGRGIDRERVQQFVDSSLTLGPVFKEFAKSGSLAEVIPIMKYFIPKQIAELRKGLASYHRASMDEIKRHKDTFVENEDGDITDFFINHEKNTTGKIHNTSDPSCLLMYNSVKEIFGAGFETSCSTLKWLFLYMVSYPRVQENVYKEIDTVVGKDRPIQPDDREQLPYIMATIYEVMRVTSIAPFAIPHKASRDTNFMGFDIDEGTFVMFNLYSINHDEKFWGDPETFRPERLLDENGCLMKERCNRIVPFGLGRRRCVGEPLAKIQIFMLFANAMQGFELKPASGKTYDLDPEPGLIYTPKPYDVVVEERF